MAFQRDRLTAMLNADRMKRLVPVCEAGRVVSNGLLQQMLFMVIERFRDNAWPRSISGSGSVGARFPWGWTIWTAGSSRTSPLLPVDAL